jgi:hypothetical protein
MTTTHRTSPSPTRSRALRVACVALVAGGVVATVVATLPGQAHDASSASFDGVREIVVGIDAGTVALERAPGTVVDVSTVRTWTSTAPDAGARVVDGVLRIDGACADDEFACSVRHAVSVPAGTPVRVEVGTGSVEATGLDVPVLAVRTDTGSVAATFATPPDRVVLLTRVGSITLTVPPGAYDVDALAGTGVVGVGIPDVPNAKSTLQVGAATGSVLVNGR